MGAQAQLRFFCAQAKLKEQAKERQQVELAERKRVAAQQEAAWVKFEQERQAIAEVEKAEEAKARAEASAMRRLAMMSGREPKPSGTPVENLQNIIGGKGSKKQKLFLMKPREFQAAPNEINSLACYLATIAIHEFFWTASETTTLHFASA